MINCYNNFYSPEVIDEIDIYEFFEKVKNPDDETRSLIGQARFHNTLDYEEDYQAIKGKLPCVTLNFSFEKNLPKSNKTIKEPTGFIYLDIDDTADLDYYHPLIFAAWRSLSGQGYGLLVKVDGLTLENFKETYYSIGVWLGIKTDKGAAKATQYTVYSYDEDIYINNDSIPWVVTSTKPPTSLSYKKKKKRYAIETGEKETIQYDNLHEIDFDRQDYLVFPDEKYEAAKAFVPKIIVHGKRNHTLFNIGAQFKALNPNISPNYIYNKIHGINNICCLPPIPENEVNKIISNILDIQNPVPFPNYPRRVIFNPEANLSRSEKQKIVNRVTGSIRSKKTLTTLVSAVYNWDYWIIGLVTQKKLKEATGKNIKTIEKYYKELRDI